MNVQNLAPNRYSPIASLVLFRLLLGLILLAATARYFLYGWIEKYYVKPQFLFSLYPFHWLPRPDAITIYLIFSLMLATAVAIILGWRYRLAVATFGLCFAYVELLDWTHYLNHHYLLGLLIGIAFFMPAHRAASLDVWQGRVQPAANADIRWLWLLRFQLGCVYFFAGIAKINPDWLLNAQPLSIWLARHSDFPIFGPILSTQWAAFAMSWAGMLYDLLVAFALLWRPTRAVAYFFVVAFHLLTYALFNIGIFPFVMIALTTIFFEPLQHKKILDLFLAKFILILSKLKLKNANFAPTNPSNIGLNALSTRLMALYVLWQILWPLRCWYWGREVLWDEQGFRFSWRVMLIEKTGTAIFTVRDSATTRESLIDNASYLTDKQIYMMSTQSDFILHYAHFLAQQYKLQGYQSPQVHVHNRVALHGHRSQIFVRNDIDLARLPLGADMLPYIAPRQY